MSKVPKNQVGRPSKNIDNVVDNLPTKAEVIKKVGLEQKQVERFQVLAEHPEIVEQTKAEARENAPTFNLPTTMSGSMKQSVKRGRLALELKSFFAEKAKENQSAYYGNQYDGLSQKSVEVHKPIDTQKELANIAGVSHDTVAKVEKIEALATDEMTNTGCQKSDKAVIDTKKQFPQNEDITDHRTSSELSKDQNDPLSNGEECSK